ncbi:MAG: arsenate reductase family protein [Paracoccaceae bacterium]
MILYGLSTCDTCKKAQKALVAAGHAVTFRDVRAEPLSEAEVTEFIVEFGSRIINTQSTTWRGLSDWMKNSEADQQLREYPALMKRPVIRSDAGLTLGWDDAIAAKYI